MTMPPAVSGRLIATTLLGGTLLGLVWTLAPLVLTSIFMGIVLVAWLRRGLSGDERRLMVMLVAVALLARALVVVGFAVASTSTLSAQSGGLLLGDEAYLFERSLRSRDVLAGTAVSRLDYMMTFDSYADTKYTWWVAWLQTTFGPSPFGIRLFNGVLFVAAASLMHRLARRAYGPAAAGIGLVTLLFLPSLLFWSTSLLKDSIYFLLTVAVLQGALLLLQGGSAATRAGGALVFGTSLWGLSDLRPWAVILTVGGLVTGLIIHWTFARRQRVAAFAVIAVIGLSALVWSPTLSARALDGVTWMSRQHIGHASTVGRAYRTLDAEFYDDYLGTLNGGSLTAGQAVRFVARSAVAFVTVPTPWQASGLFDLAYIPEQVAWYAIAILAVWGVARAYRQSPLFTSMLVGYILVMGAALAFINGNVGTLVRLRGLVTRFVVWIAAVGVMLMIARLTRPSDADSAPGDRATERGAPSPRGRANLVDLLCLIGVLGLVPAAYLSWLMFHPARPIIASVEPSQITSAEERIAAGRPIRLKVKVRGSHLTPMLRAFVGSTPAMAFTLETPASGDVVIGDDVPPGIHDLVLFDGPVEVARAPGAVTVGGGR